MIGNITEIAALLSTWAGHLAAKALQAIDGVSEIPARTWWNLSTYIKPLGRT
jgi:hypothetical protein